MSVLNGFERQRRFFSSTESRELTVPKDWMTFGFTGYSLSWLLNIPWMRSGNDKLFVFLSNHKSEARLIENSSKNTLTIIEENKYLGSLFMMGPDDAYGMYYETIERIGFVAVSKRLEDDLASSHTSLAAMNGYFDAELKSLDGFNEHATAYVKRMRSLINFETRMRK